MKRKWFLLVGLLIVAIGIFGFDFSRSQVKRSQSVSATNSSSHSQVTKSSVSHSKNERILIVYFSRTGTNYPDVTLKQGHTRRVANEIEKVTGGTMYEIVPAVPYPKNYQATVDQAQNEQDRNARPKIKDSLPNVDQYDTIFFGYPIWWGELPMIVRTFMDNVNLNGKTIIPFSTNEGSGWGNSLTTISHQYPRATVRKGFSIQGQKADTAQHQIDTWLRGLGYK